VKKVRSPVQQRKPRGARKPEGSLPQRVKVKRIRERITLLNKGKGAWEPREKKRVKRVLSRPETRRQHNGEKFF